MNKYLLFIPLLFIISEANSQSVIVGTGTAVSAFSPIIRSYDYCLYEVIYPSPEIGIAGTISKFAFERVDGTNTDRIDSVSIYMQHTILSDLTAGTFSTTGYTLVFEGSFPNDSGSGWREVTLTNPFVYDGIGNLQVLAVKGYQPAVGNTPVSPRWYYTSIAGTPARRYYGNVAISGSTNLNTTPYRCNARLDFAGVGTVELGSTALKIFPNPAGDYIKVSDGIVNATVKLFDTYGHVIYSSPFNTSEVISLQVLKSGIYYIQLTNHSTGEIKSKTIVKN